VIEGRSPPSPLLFAVHSATAREHPFISPACSATAIFDRQHIVFVVGVVLYATLALLPPFCRSTWLSGVPDWLDHRAARIGTLVSMVLVDD